LKTEIEWTHGCTGRPWSSEDGYELLGYDWAILEKQLESQIEWNERCTERPWSSEYLDELAGYDRERLEEYLGAVDLAGGATAAEIPFIA
jgi:hypothetical protein